VADTPARSQNFDTVVPDAVNRCSRRCHAAAFRGSAGRAMSRLLENGLKSVNPRGYQGGQGWLWWALTSRQHPESLPADELIGHEVHAPAVIGTLSHRGTG